MFPSHDPQQIANTSVIQTDTLNDGTLVFDNNHSSKIVIKATGTVSGSTDGKNIQIRDNDGSIGLHSFAAGDSGEFVLQANVYISGPARYDCVMSVTFGGSVDLYRTTRTALADLQRFFSLDVWVANSADSVSIRNAKISVIP